MRWLELVHIGGRPVCMAVVEAGEEAEVGMTSLDGERRSISKSRVGRLNLDGGTARWSE